MCYTKKQNPFSPWLLQRALTVYINVQVAWDGVKLWQALQERREEDCTRGGFVSSSGLCSHPWTPGLEIHFPSPKSDSPSVK